MSLPLATIHVFPVSVPFCTIEPFGAWRTTATTPLPGTVSSSEVIAVPGSASSLGANGDAVGAPWPGAHAVPFHRRTSPVWGAVTATVRPAIRATVVASWVPVTSPASSPVKPAALPVMLMPAVPPARLAGFKSVRPAPEPPFSA